MYKVDSLYIFLSYFSCRLKDKGVSGRGKMIGNILFFPITHERKNIETRIVDFESKFILTVVMTLVFFVNLILTKNSPLKNGSNNLIISGISVANYRKGYKITFA